MKRNQVYTHRSDVPHGCVRRVFVCNNFVFMRLILYSHIPLRCSITRLIIIMFSMIYPLVEYVPEILIVILWLLCTICISERLPGNSNFEDGEDYHLEVRS